ncbi:Ribosomal protein S18 acetylase RimI [Pseudomonas yamanorum]|nr:Ribosomal protein S18 acetylase RimI [Pseudomonas yamanorum]
MSGVPEGVLYFRAARVEDAPRLAHIHLQTWQAAYREILSERFLADLNSGVSQRTAFLAQAIGGGTLSVWVVELDGELVAWASFGSSRDVDAPPVTGELRALNLLPGIWGQGIGTRLWGRVREQLIEAGFISATVWVVQGNRRALGFYRALGFVAEPHTAKTVVEHDEPLPLVRYRVQLKVFVGNEV